MAYEITFPSHYLAIDDVPLSTPAWEVLNLEDLESGPDVRGQTRVVPGAVGVRANRRRPTVTAHSLEMYFHGTESPEGESYAEGHFGILANLAAFRAAVVSQPTSGVTRTAVLYLPVDPESEEEEPDQPSVSGAVQVTKFAVGKALSPVCVPATLAIEILGGSLA